MRKTRKMKMKMKKIKRGVWVCIEGVSLLAWASVVLSMVLDGGRWTAQCISVDSTMPNPCRCLIYCTC
jgi:hypothetical protein